MSLTFEQFAEIVSEEVEKRISRDMSYVQADRDWEDLNLAEALATRLRQNGVNLPFPIAPQPTRDLSEFEGR